MSNYSLKEASSQTVNDPNNDVFLDETLADELLTFRSIDISEDYPEIEKKSFVHFTMLYYRINNNDTSTHALDFYTSMQIHKLSSTEADPRSWYQIFYKRTINDDEDAYHWHSANLIVPIIKDADGKSYINFKIGALAGGSYYLKLLIRGGIA